MKDRDQLIKEHILKEGMDHASSHLGPKPDKHVNTTVRVNKEWAKTKKYRVALVMAPAWGVLFPPYNTAKLAGLLRHYDYSTKVYDLNVEVYQGLKDKLEIDLWRSENYYLWTLKENFDEQTFPHIKSYLDNLIKELIASKPKVIGFSVYNTNIFAVLYMLEELKKHLPNTCFVAGGPEVSTSTFLLQTSFNYLFVGEAEETFLYLLENLPNQYPTCQKIGSNDSKLNLEKFPFPDYSDYNFNNYQQTDGVSIETSRGCVAQCSFCSETNFWKFRSNTADRVVEEIEHQVNTYKVRRFWFVDSLVNGNLKVLERIVDLIIEKKLNIRWNSYARCDGRMTKEFIKKIKDSGCSCLSYGVESGSQKVLHDMRKKVEVWEIENNLKHGTEVKLFNHVNWIIGFPTEEPIDCLHSYQLIANARKHIHAISPGFGAGPAFTSHMFNEWKIYGIQGDNFIQDKTFLDTWYTENHANTILHRFLRIKLFHIWLEVLKEHASSTIENTQRYTNIKDSYTFSTPGNNVKEYCDYDNYVNLQRYNDHLKMGNEFFALAYAMFQYFGEYELTVTCDPVTDTETFGSWLVNDYKANFTVKVSHDGSYSLKLTHTFNHSALDKLKEPKYETERNISDKSFNENIVETGNFNDWVSDKIQTKETVHEQYRNKKKVITILQSDE